MVTSWSVWTQEYRSKSAPKPLLAMDEMKNNWTHVPLRIIWRPAYRTIQTTRENEKPYYNERMSKQTKISWIHETRQRQVQMALFRTSSHLSSLASQTSHTLLSPLSSHSTHTLQLHFYLYYNSQTRLSKNNYLKTHTWFDWNNSEVGMDKKGNMG